MLVSAIGPALDKLGETITQVHPALMQQLQPGLSGNDIDKLLNTVQVQFTTELYALFSWKNGVKNIDNATPEAWQIFPMGIPYSLANAVEAYQSASLKQHLFETDYFPFFYSGHGDILLYNMDESNPTYRMISLYSPELLGTNTPKTIYDSLPSLVDTMLTCYAKQIFWISQGKLEFDSDGHYNVASELNPNSYYWQYL